MIQRIPFDSSSSDKVYYVTVANDGSLSCDCRGWTMKKGDKPRECKHTRDVLATRGAQPAPAPVSNQPKPVTNREGYIQPMLATPLEGRRIAELNPNDWWLEEKWDGHRVIVAIGEGQAVSAWSRPAAGGKEGLSRDLPEHILAVLRQFPCGTFDCELIVPGGKNAWDVANLKNRHLLQLVVFDVLIINGEDLCKQPAIERNDMLNRLGATLVHHGVAAVRVSDTQLVSMEAIEAIWARGGEGAMLKRKSSIYKPGHRSPDWIKVKKLHSDVLTIVAFEPGEMGPYSTVVLEDRKRGLSTAVKTLNNYWLAVFAKYGAKYIGRQLRIEHQGLFKGPKGSKFRHPMWDHIIEQENA